MGLTQRLRKLGGRLGLLQVVQPTSEPGRAAHKHVTRALTLEELIAEVRSNDARALADLPPELTLAFERIFEAAEVRAPESGWTVARLQQLLRSGAYKSLDPASARDVVAKLLEAQQASVKDILKDAIARDLALDAFEEFAKRKLGERTDARKRRIAELDAQARALRDEMARLRDESKQESLQWRDWLGRKIAFEQDMAWALGFVLDHPVVSVAAPLAGDAAAGENP